MKKIAFFGTRGSASLTSDKYLEFGGATSCIFLNLDGTNLMVDCGSGIVNAYDALRDSNELDLLITHSHIDHIAGIPTLLSTFGNKKIRIYGKTYNGVSVKESINRIMSQSLWPVRADTYKNVEFFEIDGFFRVGGVTVRTMDSSHPGGCTLFRLESENECLVTAFDFCHLDGFEAKLCEFAKGCKTLIYDGYFTESELSDKADWGHSTPDAGARIGNILGCSEVYITHFGYRDDETLARTEKEVQKINPAVVFARSGKRKDELQRMVDIGALLSAEKDHDALLLKIVEAGMDITGADGGTLYLLDNDALEFKVLINRSMNTRLVRRNSPLSIPSVSINGKNICSAAAREKKQINVPDCYAETAYDFSGTKEYDARNGYRTVSVLVIPLKNEYDDVMGVLQLINAENAAGEIVAFRHEDEGVLLAIANQVSMAIVNSAYSAQINDLLYGFVKVMSVGIDERTPYNANHTRNMVRFAEKFFDYEETWDGPYKVDGKERREILMSIWLHDIGKILTPMDIMNKDSRLGDMTNETENRFERRELLLKLAKAEGKLSSEEYEKAEKERRNQLLSVRSLNKAGFLNDDLRAELDNLNRQVYVELDGTETPVLTKEEVYRLSIVKGTLTREERSIMEGHAAMTQKFLSQLQFPKYYDKIPAYAGNHHEMLDGSGYPNHLTEGDLPWPCRFITVCDIYEALTAKDRPYKKPMSPEKAFSILSEMALSGKLDGGVIAEFEKSGAWQYAE